jgi:hypothetical protein
MARRNSVVSQSRAIVLERSAYGQELLPMIPVVQV